MHCIIVLMYHVGIDDFENRICMYTKLNRTFKLLKMVMYRLCPLLRVLFCTHVAQWSSKWGRSMPHFWIEYRFFKRSKLAKITTIKKKVILYTVNVSLCNCTARTDLLVPLWIAPKKYWVTRMGRHDVMLVVIDHNLQWTDTERKRLGCRLAGVLISDFLPWLPSHIRNHMENQLFLPCNIQIDNENTSHLVF